METPLRTRVLVAVMVAGIVVAGVLWSRQLHPVRDRRPAPNYYSGPMVNKSNPTLWSDDDGHRVERPSWYQGPAPSQDRGRGAAVR